MSYWLTIYDTQNRRIRLCYQFETLSECEAAYYRANRLLFSTQHGVSMFQKYVRFNFSQMVHAAEDAGFSFCLENGVSHVS